MNWCLKPCPHWRLQSPNSATAAEFGDSRRFRRQIVAVSRDYSRQCGQDLTRATDSSKQCESYLWNSFYLIKTSLRHLAEVHDKQMNVNRKPKNGKHDDHQHQCASNLSLLFVSATSGSSPGDCQVIAAWYGWNGRHWRRSGGLVTSHMT